jgi:hypothetical protein
MNKSTQLKIYVVVVTLICLGLITTHLNKLGELEKLNEELIECKTDRDNIPGGDIEAAELQDRLDSLTEENFIKSTQLGRYELTLDELKKTHPKAFIEFEKYFYTQTE